MKETLFQTIRDTVREKRLPKKRAGAAAAALSAAAVAGALAASSIGAPESGAQTPVYGASLPGMAAPAAVWETEAAPANPDEAHRARRRKAAKAVAAAAKGVGALVFSLLAQGASLLLRGLWSVLFGGPLAGLLGFLCETLAIFALLLIVFLLLFKALFPNKKCKDFLTLRNLLLLLAASFALAGVRRIAFARNLTLAVAAALLRALLSLGCVGGALCWCFSKEGVGARALRRACKSRAGKGALCALIALILASAAVRALAAGAGSAGAFAECALLFLLAAAAAVFWGFCLRKAQTYPRLKPEIVLPESV